MKNSNLLKYRSHWLAIVLMSCIAVFLVCIAGYREYNDEYSKAELASKSFSLVLGQHTEATFEKINLALKSLQKIFSITDPSKMTPEEISRLLFEMKSNVPEAEIMGVADIIGNDLGNTGWIKDGGKTFSFEKIFIGDRAYFIQQKNDLLVEFVISKPIISRTTGSLIVNISRKLPLKNGKFSGIVFATLNLKLFSDFFSKISNDQVSEDNTIALFNWDKVLLARFPFDKSQVGNKFVSAIPIMDSIKSGSSSGNYINTSPLDHITKIFGYKSLDKLGMVVVVGKNKNSLFRAWWRQQGVSALLLVLCIFASIIGLAVYIKKIQEEEKQKELALQSSKMAMLGEMSAGIAHEIINPLSVIKMYSTSLLSAIKNEKVDLLKFNTNLQKIENMCVRIEKIIRGLKSYSRNSSQDPLENTSLYSVVETAIELTSTRYKMSGVPLTFSECPQVKIYCREAEISQVLINLLNNASDSVSKLDEKWVNLDYKIIGDKIQIFVTDSGAGIPLEIAEKLMTPFFTTKPLNQGTGLGLSISKRIVEEHQGKLFLVQECKNTRFVVELPISTS